MHCSFDSPIFVVGASRSGTTLVYSILLSSGEFPIYEAETLLLEACPMKYGNLKNKKNYQRFMNDWLRSKQFMRSGLDPEEFKKEAKFYRNNYIDFLRFFMESIAKKQDKNRWVEKTPRHLKYMKQLSDAFPSAKFIHVIRDGRDVALSKRKLGWTGTRSKNPIKQLLFAAVDWERTVNYGRACGKKLSNNYIEIRYEDIICNLDKVLKRINDFAHVRIDINKIEDSSIGSFRKINTAFNSTMKGISDKALWRWKKMFSKEEIDLIELVIGKTLFQLGYEVNVSKNYKFFLYWKIKMKKILYLLFIYFKDFIKQKLLIGRLMPSGLEIYSEKRLDKLV